MHEGGGDGVLGVGVGGEGGYVGGGRYVGCGAVHGVGWYMG